MSNWLRRLLTQRKRHLTAAWQTLRSLVFAGIAEISVIFLIIILGQSGLLDIRTIVSVAVTEVGIGVFLYHILGESRRSHVDEVLNLMDATEKLSHLRVLTFAVYPRPFRYWFYYVENTATKQAYIAPEYIEDMADRGVIAEIECKNEMEMKEILNKNKSTLNERMASLSELLKPTTRRVGIKK